MALLLVPVHSLLATQGMGVTILTLKVPNMTAADDKFCIIFLSFRKKKGMIFHENRLPADDSHEICLICYFRKGGNI